MSHEERMREIGELLRTQDNRMTDAPIFIVQERVRDYGYDVDYCDDHVWLDAEGDCTEADDQERAILDASNGECDLPGDWQKTGYRDRWKFVTACFTEQGCKDFIEADGHNHGELRIYADGSYRNAEYRAVREYLIAMAEELTGGGDNGAQ